MPVLDAAVPFKIKFPLCTFALSPCNHIPTFPELLPAMLILPPPVKFNVPPNVVAENEVDVEQPVI